MTIDKREVITIPKWLVILFVPLIFGGVGGFATGSFGRGQVVKQVEVNTKRLDSVEKDKIGQGEMSMLKTQLDRIETRQARIEEKLDKHIIK
jgi:hypothetical protein